MGSQDLSLKVVLQAADQASGTLKGFGSTLINLAGDAGPLLGGMLAISAAVVGIGAQAVSMAADYQQQMNMVQALTGSNAQQMAYYDSQVKKLAVDAGVAPTALAKGLYNVLSAGYQGADAMKVLTLATEDAKIGMTDSATTTDALTRVLANFTWQTKDATLVNGTMLETVTLGQSSFQQYASTITKAASTSAQFHINLQTMSAAWATMTANGIKAAQASTDYVQLVQAMDGKIGTITKSLHKNGIAFNEAKFNAADFGTKVQMLNQALQTATQKHVTITGVTLQAAQALTTISGHMGVYNSNLATLSNKQAMADKTQSAWATTQAGFNQTLSRAQAAVSVFMIDIGQKLLPVLTQIVGAVAPAVTWLIQFASAVLHNQVAVDFLIGGLVGFAALIIMLVVPAFIAWATAAWAAAIATLAATWPFILAAAIIAVVVAAIILAIQHWGQIVAWLQGVWSAVAGFFVNLWNQILAGLRFQAKIWGMIWQGIVSGLQSAWNGMVSLIQNALKGIVDAFTAPFRAIGALFSWLYNHNYYFKMLVDRIHAIIFMALVVIQAKWQQFVGWLVGIWNSLVGFATTAYNNLKNAIMSVVLAIGNWELDQWDKVSKWLSDKWNSFAGLATKAWQLVSGVFGSIWNKYISGPLGNLWNSISGWFGGLATQALKWGQNMITGFLNGVKSMFGQSGQTMGSFMGNVASYLGFHSPAQKGEGQHIVEWGANMLKGFSSGMLSYLPTMQAQVAMVVKNGLQPMSPPALANTVPYGRIPTSSNSYSSIAGGGNHYGNNSIVISGAGNPDAVAQAVMKKLNQQYRRSGTMSNLASGGRSS